MFNVTWMSPGPIGVRRRLNICTRKTGRDEEYAARLYGLLVCRIAIERARDLGECWFTFKQEIGEDGHTSRSYVLKCN